ncbi:PLCH1 phosphodiesterase, partial [Struthidea cinerea]|nr:PLCH1 phosphodiesterase [Struthidea cinerea]
ERQEAAGKHRPCDGSGVTGVVLRSKAAGAPHAVNRHSTGSYIARYLHGCPGERRGAPEGACSALQHGCGDGLCGHGPGLQLP